VSTEVPAAFARRIFEEVHTDLPREAPGSAECTERALAALGGGAGIEAVLDIACGPGTQTLDLARLLPDAWITAIDLHRPFIERARERARAAGVADRVTFETADMNNLSYPDASFDLLWCEGGIYLMGVLEALDAWRRLLVPGGAVAFTDAVWLGDAAPQALEDWWTAEYAKIGSIDNCLDLVAAAGFSVLEHFVLPETAWEAYYGPMQTRIDVLGERYRGDQAALSVLAESEREIDYYRRWSAHYGYLFVVARRVD
jgi:ubiquinone/menaquinone biosynthesis C-methylase UbiE